MCGLGSNIYWSQHSASLCEGVSTFIVTLTAGHMSGFTVVMFSYITQCQSHGLGCSLSSCTLAELSLFTLLKLLSQFLAHNSCHNCHIILVTFLQSKVVFFVKGEIVKDLNKSSSGLLCSDRASSISFNLVPGLLFVLIFMIDGILKFPNCHHVVPLLDCFSPSFLIISYFFQTNFVLWVYRP